MSHSSSTGKGRAIQSQDTIESFEQHHLSAREMPLARHGYDRQESSTETGSVHTNLDSGHYIRSSGAPQPIQGPQEASQEKNVRPAVDIGATATRYANQASERTRHEPAEPTLDESQVASERVATVTLQCLSKDMDMEMSYVSILSAITVLQSIQDQPQDFDDTSRKRSGSKKIARTFSQILIIMCRPNIADRLAKETLHQGVMSPEALYTQFYGSVQEAGYDLEVSLSSNILMMVQRQGISFLTVSPSSPLTFVGRSSSSHGAILGGTQKDRGSTGLSGTH